MPKLQVAFKKTIPKVALVQADGASAPSGYAIAGKFDHPDPVYPGSLVLAQGVQEALYHVGEQNMQEVKVELAANLTVAYVVQIDADPAHIELRGSDPLYKNAQLNARAWPPGAKDTSLTFASSNTAVATVNAYGQVKSVGNGSAVITITAPGSATTPKLTKQITVTVSGVLVPDPVAVTGVTVAPTTSTKVVGETQQLTPTVAPADASNKAVTYTSATPAVATVNASGLVTAVSAGTAVITVKTTDGNKTATHTITVTAAP